MTISEPQTVKNVGRGDGCGMRMCKISRGYKPNHRINGKEVHRYYC